MKIFLTKTGTGEHAMSCKRDDGSVTWKLVSSFFITHDICHYAVETIIPLKQAFFGLIKAGTNITDFELPKEQRGHLLTGEALFAEHLVNLLTIEYAQGKMDNFIEIFNSINDGAMDKQFNHHITEGKLEKIRTKYNKLMREWQSLPENETMILLFEQ